MLHGQVSKAADVYAFGITLWEIFTSGLPYKGTPGALLPHQVSKEGRRPIFPLGTPAGYRELAERCWALAVADRCGCFVFCRLLVLPFLHAMLCMPCCACHA